MTAPRLLVIEGNSPQTLAEHVTHGGVPASDGYAALLSELLPNAQFDICYPAHPGAELPQGAALEGYDGIAITGSGLHVYSGAPEVTRQVELVHAALNSGTPIFGSCWGCRCSRSPRAAACGGIRKAARSASADGFG